MFRKSWYKLLAWVMATFYFFIFAGVVISIFSPGPSEEQAMQWMQGMMKAMHTSLMGWTMEENIYLNQLFIKTAALTVPAIFAGVIIGILLKLRGDKVER